MSEQSGTWGPSPGAPPPDVGWGEAPAWGAAAADAGWGAAPAADGGWAPPQATAAVPAATTGWGAPAPAADDGWGGGAAPDVAWRAPEPNAGAGAWGLPAAPDAGWGAPVEPVSKDAGWGLPAEAASPDAGWGAPAGAVSPDAGWGAPAPPLEVAWGSPPADGEAMTADAAWGLPSIAETAPDAAWGLPAAEPASDAAWGLPAPADTGGWDSSGFETPVPDAPAFDPLASFEAEAPANDVAFFDAFLQDIQNGDAAPVDEPSAAPEPDPVYEAPREATPVYEAPTYVEPAYAEPQPAIDEQDYGEQPVFDENATYGEPLGFDEQTTYGDQAPADAQPSYGEQPSYDHQPAYADEQVYGDEPLADEAVRGYETLEAEFEAAGEAEPSAEEWDPLGEPGLWDDGAADASAEAAPEPEPTGKTKPAKGPKAPPGPGAAKVKQLAIAASSLALLGTMSAGGWYLATDGGEQPLPGLGLSFVTSFFGPSESAEVVAALKENATIVRQAVDAHMKEKGKLPKSQGQVLEAVTKIDKTRRNPFYPDEPMLIVLGAKPYDPGVVAVEVVDDRYIVRVGGADGKPFKMGEKEFQLTGGLGDVVAARPSSSPEFPTAANSPGTTTKPSASPAVAATVAPPVMGAVPYPPSVPLVLLAGAPGAPTMSGGPAVIVVPIPDASVDIAGNVTENVKHIQRNRAFDTYRLRGIALVYEARTSEAIRAFRQALAIKPDDPAVKAWLASVEEAIAKKESSKGGEGGESGGQSGGEAAVDVDQLIRQRMAEIGKRSAPDPVLPNANAKGREAPARPAAPIAIPDGLKPPLLPPPKL